MFIEAPGYQLFEKISENDVFTVYRGQREQDHESVVINSSQPNKSFSKVSCPFMAGIRHSAYGGFSGKCQRFRMRWKTIRMDG